MRQKRKTIIIIILLATALVTIAWWGANIRNGFYFFSSPLSRLFWSKGGDVSNFFSALWQSQGLKSENEKLTRENIGLKQQLTQLMNQQTENLNLKTVLGLATEKEWQMETADILSKELNRDIITINKGRLQGITVNMPVVTQEAVLAGRVSEVFDNFAKVTLISDTESNFNIEIQIGQNPAGIARGKTNLKMSFDYIPKEEEIHRGDLVVTAALGEIFPKGIAVGEVLSVQKNDAEPYQQGDLKPFFADTALKTVLVIKKYQ